MSELLPLIEAPKTPDQLYDDTEKAQAAREALTTIPPHYADVLRRRMGFHDGKEWTFEEIGAHLDVTREWVRQMEARALRMLRHPSRSRALKPFDGDGCWNYD